MKNNIRGFTLIEIMIVLAIIALLVSMAIVEGVQFRKQANESNAQVNLNTIATGFEVYAARHSGVYAQGTESNLEFLVADGCLFQDLVNIGQIGNFQYTVGSIGPGGYDMRAMAVNPALSDHNYQIVTGGQLRRTDTPSPSDTDFKIFK
ncbi:MAG: prepilin-type N-terminal cleavage/methylation domain-containing protein [Candidatus Omnitrophota bacterium]